MESWVWIATALLAVFTLVQVYRGGTTLNDHAVAMVVLGCLLIYPTLGEGALGAGVQGVAWEVLSIALVQGALGIYGLFHVLGRKRDPGWLIWWGRWSQPCYAFSLWTGLL
ncbi:MAG: hypothetical protein QGG40_04930, partial [Myxococcota bacterium]|nr:hypothetical protein [Myxococcota bacterium]